MRSALILVSAGAALLLAAFTRSQDPEPRPSDAVLARLEILEKQVANIEAWIQAQAKQAEAFALALDDSEKEGFIYGINPRSREVLLAAFRDQSLSLRTAVPGAPPEEPAAEVTPPAPGGGGR